MNKTIQTITIATTMLIFSTASHAQESLRVIDNGKDGNISYYTIICPSGKRTSANFNYDDGMVCTVIVNGKEEVCRKDWTVDNAAKQACE